MAETLQAIWSPTLATNGANRAEVSRAMGIGNIQTV